MDLHADYERSSIYFILCKTQYKQSSGDKNRKVSRYTVQFAPNSDEEFRKPFFCLRISENWKRAEWEDAVG